MLTFENLIAAVQAGHQPIVQFQPAISEMNLYVEGGMLARVIEARGTSDGRALVVFNFHAFDEYNLSFESARFACGEDAGLRTGREAGLYKAQESLTFGVDVDVELYFLIEKTERLQIFREYISSGGPARLSYVQWLEQKVLSLPPFSGTFASLPATGLASTLELVEVDGFNAPGEGAGGVVESGDIKLEGPFTATSKTGASWKVHGLYIEKQGYIADLYVRMAEPGAIRAQLYDDDAFISGIMARLQAIGYQGSPFGRAELGMQSDDFIALEPCSDFEHWVTTTKGWVHLTD